MDLLINKLRGDFPEITFITGSPASWSLPKQQIIYDPDEEYGTWTLLHELGHAQLQHASYESDALLLQKETAAWDQAILLATHYGEKIENEYIQLCLDTYRDWLHRRSTCPDCGNHGLQSTQELYSCPNCQTTWKVSLERFCRPYRLKKALAT
jgi:hypothetical protein